MTSNITDLINSYRQIASQINSQYEGIKEIFGLKTRAAVKCIILAPHSYSYVYEHYELFRQITGFGDIVFVADHDHDGLKDLNIRYENLPDEWKCPRCYRYREEVTRPIGICFRCDDVMLKIQPVEHRERWGVILDALAKPAPYDMEKDLERLRATRCPSCKEIHPCLCGYDGEKND